MLLEEIKNIKSEKGELRKFVITIGIVLGLLAGLLWWKEKNYYITFIILSTAFILIGLILPILLKPLQKVWMTLAIVLGWLMTRVILSILFYFVVTSIGLIARLLGKQFLDLRMNNPKKSFWIYREPKEFKKSDYERQF